jgi:hypothetical protein
MAVAALASRFLFELEKGDALRGAAPFPDPVVTLGIPLCPYKISTIDIKNMVTHLRRR